MDRITRYRPSLRRVLVWFGWVGAYIVLSTFLYHYFPMRHHWPTIFRPAALALGALHSPYSVVDFYNPPWALLPIIPFALLPERVGWALYAAFSLFAYGFSARRLGASWLLTLAFLLLPHTLYNLIQVNVDWMIGLGILLPPEIGLFFVLVKPQTGGFLALYWLIEAWQRGKSREVLRVFGPVLAAFLLSGLLFGPWMSRSVGLVMPEDKHFWPVSIPIGLMLLYLAFRDRRKGLCLSCAPLLAPYTQFYSWPVALLGLLPSKLWMFVMVATLWLFGDNGTKWLSNLFSDIFCNLFTAG